VCGIASGEKTQKRDLRKNGEAERGEKRRGSQKKLRSHVNTLRRASGGGPTGKKAYTKEP